MIFELILNSINFLTKKAITIEIKIDHCVVIANTDVKAVARKARKVEGLLGSQKAFRDLQTLASCFSLAF